jgi:hypothetical protein
LERLRIDDPPLFPPHKICSEPLNDPHRSDEEMKDSDISFMRDSSRWKEVDLQLCRLAKGARGTVTLVLDVVLNLELSERKDVFSILDGTKFLSEFLKAGGIVRFE